MRQLLLRESTLKSLCELPADTISGAVVGRWCAASYEKTKTDSDYPVRLYCVRPDSMAHHPIDASTASPTSIEYVIKKSVLVSRDCQRFRIVFNDIDRDICTLIDSLNPLASLATGHTGIRALHGQQTVLSNQQHSPAWRRGLKSGAAVQSYLVKWDGSWLHINENLLYRGGYDQRVIENPKILIRQTGDKITAAFDDSNLYHLNNIHSLSPKIGFAPDLHYLVGLLNSNLWLYLYRLKTREQGRALAQIDIETMESMPLPNSNDYFERGISTLARTCADLAKKDKTAESLTVLKRAIDSLVYASYELDKSKIEQIERSCGKLSTDSIVLPSIDEAWRLTESTENSPLCHSRASS